MHKVGNAFSQFRVMRNVMPKAFGTVYDPYGSAGIVSFKKMFYSFSVNTCFIRDFSFSERETNLALLQSTVNLVFF